MLEATDFLPSAKATLRRSGYAVAMEQADECQRQIFGIDPSPYGCNALAELVRALESALAHAPDGEAWTTAWTRYALWQPYYELLLDVLVPWIHRGSDEDGHDDRFQHFQLIYGPDPYPVTVAGDVDDELVRVGLFQPFPRRTDSSRSWQTALGHALVERLRDDV